VTGIDPSEEGIAIVREAFPELDLHRGSAYDDLAARFGQFPAVVSLEVVEHVYYPRKYASCVYDLLEENGIAIISTPYHGYWKNLALALTGKMDDHFGPLWTHGHIKFWSRDTLSQLLREAVALSGEERLAMGRRGRALVAERYSWEHVAEQVRAFYAWLIGRQSRPSCIRSQIASTEAAYTPS
jgi:2-polyprenyl-6-hydroxyphenyl methylase/3-demethylubiquinone-9 3-methyltransferase